MRQLHNHQRAVPFGVAQKRTTSTTWRNLLFERRISCAWRPVRDAECPSPSSGPAKAAAAVWSALNLASESVEHPPEIEIATHREILHQYRPSVGDGNCSRSLWYEVTNLGQGEAERPGQAPALVWPTGCWHVVELVGSVFSATK